MTPGNPDPLQVGWRLAFSQVKAQFRLAEDRGFEPLRAFTQHAFQACALGHYANPPPQRLSPPAARPKSRRQPPLTQSAGCVGHLGGVP